MSTYICSKPLQIMVAMMHSDRSDGHHLYIVDWFEGAEHVSRAPALLNFFETVTLFPSRRAAMLETAKLRVRDVWLDSDIGLVPCLFMWWMRINRGRVGIYEEGVGTYRADLISSAWKRNLIKLIGGSTFFGESRLVREVSLFEPSRYASIFPRHGGKVTAINGSLSEWGLSHFSMLIEIFAPGYELPLLEEGPDGIAVFLTNWALDFDELKKLGRNEAFYVKPHPHLKGNVLGGGELNSLDIVAVPASIPAELLFLMLLDRYKKIRVFHYGSSAVHYFSSDRLVDFMVSEIN